MPWRLGFDIGGTFTDFALQDVDTGAIIIGKTLTTPRDPAEGVFRGLADLLKAANAAMPDIRQALHGTTLGANIIIERKGARTFLLTTRGFRDLLEIQRQLRYNINDLFVDKHPPLIPRNQIFEISERTLADGTVYLPLDAAEVQRALEACRAAGAESLAVSFLHAYANPEPEEATAKLAAQVLPGVPVTLSSAISPQYREYERTNTAVVNAYITPRFRAYLDRLRGGFAGLDFRRPLYLMQNNGGIATAEMAARFPVRSVDSGPAAGALMAAHLGRLTGHADLIAFDMGGTTAKACLIEGGQPARTDRLEVDMIGMRHGSGLPINVPSIDLVEIGAGGGSIARLERGLLRVGPESAGADPGPACYARGGGEPTVTDANLLLGYLDPTYFLGGAQRLDAEAARAAIEERVARPMGLALMDAAWGIHQMVTLSMEGAMRVVSIGRGKDPRQFACVAFGGAGPIHGARLARSLGSRRLIVPFGAGVTSAIGLLIADATFDLARTLVACLEDAPWERINRLFADMEAEGAALLRETGLQGDWRAARMAEVRYAGQGHELDVALPAGRLGPEELEGIRRAHAAVYAARYGYAEPPGAPLEATNWKLSMICLTPKIDLARQRPAGAQAAGGAQKGERRAYMPEAGGVTMCPVHDRYRLGPGLVVRGPAIIEERETTVVLLPGDEARVDEYASLIVDISV